MNQTKENTQSFPNRSSVFEQTLLGICRELIPIVLFMNAHCDGK